jgi:hypothetical protein
MKWLVKLYAILATLLLLGCVAESTGPDEGEEFAFVYSETGGIGGIHNILKISVDDSVTYTSSHYRIRTVLGPSDKQGICSILTQHGFFGLGLCYCPDKPIADDIGYTLHYTSDSRSHHVSASGSCSGSHHGCSWPNGLHAIIDSLRQVVSRLKEQITTGCVTVYSHFTLGEWPFGQVFSLADYLSRQVEIPDSLFWRIRTDQQQDPPIQYYEDGWIYRLNASIHYATSYDDPEPDTTLSIHDRTQPVYWNYQPSLSEALSERIVLTGPEYVWLRDIFRADHYPWYFMDDSLADSALVYQLRFVHGNDCWLK